MAAFSVVIPAFNEERYLPDTLGAIRRAAAALGEEVEVIVADNGSTDGTAAVARDLGARVVPVEIRCISAVRNQAGAQATGRYLVFVDADDHVSENMFIEIKHAMETGRYIGGGVANVRYDRESLGIRITHGLINAGVALSGLSMFLFYTTPEAFRAVGGFNEELLSAEDYDFARRLRKLARERGLKYKNLHAARLVKSSRKFTEYGDWSLFRHPLIFAKAMMNDRETAYELWYRPRR
jgi:glycosyltransferase involved in cell wall biosynthesis